MSGGYRFGISRLPPSGATLRRQVDDYEAAGFDFVATGDHIERGVAPFATLAAAAVVSESIRLRTYVVNTGLWNPAFLAREAATLDRLSEGRLELGLGAGNAKSEFLAVGAAWRPSGDRVERMREVLVDVRRSVEVPHADQGPRAADKARLSAADTAAEAGAAAHRRAGFASPSGGAPLAADADSEAGCGK